MSTLVAGQNQGLSKWHNEYRDNGSTFKRKHRNDSRTIQALLETPPPPRTVNMSKSLEHKYNTQPRRDKTPKVGPGHQVQQHLSQIQNKFMKSDNILSFVVNQATQKHTAGAFRQLRNVDYSALAQQAAQRVEAMRI